MHTVQAQRGVAQSAIYTSVDQLAAELGIGRKAAYDGLKAGIIPSIRIGKRYVLPKTAIQKWLESAGRLQAA